MGVYKKFLIYFSKLMLFSNFFGSFQFIEDLFWFYESFLWTLKILVNFLGFIDLFGLYGMFLISFGVLCMFLLFSMLSKLSLDRLKKKFWLLGFLKFFYDFSSVFWEFIRNSWYISRNYCFLSDFFGSFQFIEDLFWFSESFLWI